MSSSSSTVSRVLHAGIAVVSAGVLVLSGFGWWATDHYIGEVGHETVFASDPTDANAPSRPTVDPRAGDSMNILLVGSDNRDGLSQRQRAELHVGSLDYGLHTDTMMLIHLGKDTNHISVVGFPRDSVVDIPKCTSAEGVKYGSKRTRINEAFARGGGKCMVDTVEKATNIKIDHYVEVSFTAFLGMVDAIGGVDVCLAKPLKDNQKYTGLDLPAGRSTLQGPMALNFVRARHIDSDFGRIQRQQQFIASMLQKATGAGTLTNPVALNDFISAALKNTKVDETLDKQAILDLAGRLQGIKFSSIEFPKIPIQDGNYTDPSTGAKGLVKWADNGAAKLFDAIRTDTPITKEAAGTATPSATPTATVATSEIRVAVQNGTPTKGLGATVSNELKGLGYRISAAPRSAAKSTYATTVLRYDPTYSESVKTLAATFPGATLTPVTGLGRTIQVIVGAGYSGVTTPVVKSPGSSSTSSGIEATVASDTVCS